MITTPDVDNPKILQGPLTNTALLLDEDTQDDNEIIFF